MITEDIKNIIKKSSTNKLTKVSTNNLSEGHSV